jgi:3-oxoacyl-[acyl-carrier-protein] synthase I
VAEPPAVEARSGIEAAAPQCCQARHTALCGPDSYNPPLHCALACCSGHSAIDSQTPDVPSLSAPIQPIAPIQVSAYTATSAVGVGKAALFDALEQQRSGLRPNDFSHAPLATWIGRVAGIEASPLPPSLAHWECRNHRLAWLGLTADGFLGAALAARERHGAARVALVLGTSTSSVGATEEAYRHLDADGCFPETMRSPKVNTPHSLGMFVHEALRLEGPCVTVSTACSSSAKAFAQAERMIRLGLVDAAVVGGVDSLCGSVLFGFNALSLLAPQACRPFDARRNGISIGEAAGFALLERGGGALQLLGYGESSDAHHMSAPHPQGEGAERALDDALARAGLDTDAIDCINLHGTASTKNDEVEAALVARRFSARTHASSTKGLAGHALGAAGMLEAAVSLLTLETGLMPGTANTSELDPVCGPQMRLSNARGRVRHVLSNSFGFGGNNCVLAFGRGSGSH